MSEYGRFADEIDYKGWEITSFNFKQLINRKQMKVWEIYSFVDIYEMK